MLSIAASGELYTSLIISTLSLLPFIPQTKEVQMQKAENSNFNTDNIVIVTMPIQIVKTLKIHKFDFFYSDQDKMKR